MEVSDLDQIVLMLAMKDSLRPLRFLFSLEKWFSTNFAKMLARAEKYANTEEAISIKRSRTTNQMEKKEKRKERNIKAKG